MVLTNPNGRYFVSYRRREPRIAEIDSIKSILDNRGVPTWLDRANLRLGPTAGEIEEIIRDLNTAGAVLYMTPEIAKDAEGTPSLIIQELEVPKIMERAQRDPLFVTILVAAGGLTYADADTIYGDRVALANFPDLNALQLQGNLLSADGARTIGKRVLAERLQVVQGVGPREEPVLLTLNTRVPTPFQPEVTLALDWDRHFQGRHCPEAVWINELVPALCDVREAIQLYVPRRKIIASGSLAIPAALLLGVVFSRTSNVSLGWLQAIGEPVWLPANRVEGVKTPVVSIRRGDFAGRDVLLMVSVTQDVQPDVNSVLGDLPPMRAVVTANWSGYSPIGAVEANEIAAAVREALVRARGEFDADGTLHAFLAVPAGLAVLIGQNLNTFLPLQTYEHDRDRKPSYQSAYLLREADLC